MPDWIDSAVQWLLNLSTLRPGDDGVLFQLEYPLAPWQWTLVALAAMLIAGMSYRRLTGKAWARAALASGRALLLLLLVFLLCGPKLARPSETIEKDWVVVLVDRSGSMRITDAGADATQRREEQLRAALTASSPMWQQLERDRVVTWLGFDAGTFDLKPETVGTPALGEPLGRRTNIGQALESALARAAARPVAGIVVLSDGRSTDALPRTALRKLAAERIGVYSVPLGSPEARSDMSLRQVEAPSAAFVNDIVPVHVKLDRLGSVAKAGGGTLKLIDVASGRVLDEKRISFAPGATSLARPITLTSRPENPGDTNWLVKLEPDGPDLLPANNQASLKLALVDRPLRVLYIDGYPRWEYRYIKNVLSREKSVSFAATLLAVGRRYLQEGSETLEAIPATPKEWEQWDVIMLGDVRPDVFTPAQLEQLKARVSLGGAGLLWIAGEGAVPTAWRSTPLGDLLPMSFTGDSAAVRSWGAEVTLSPTPLAEVLGVLRLRDETGVPSEPGAEPISAASDASPFWPEELGDPRVNWARLKWVQRLEPGTLKPAVETLAVATPAQTSDGEPTPAVVTMRFGAGRVIYVATDEIWRWRYGRGEKYPERFYLQLLRLLGRESVARSGRPAILAVEPSRADVNQPVRVTTRLIDQRLADAAPASLRVRIERVSPKATENDVAESIELTLRPETGGEGTPESGTQRVYSATWVPSAAGQYRATLTDALVASLPEAITADAEVTLSDDELRSPETDHDLLKQLSTSTGGAVLKPESLNDLAKLLPRREIRTAGISEQHTLWDTPAALLSLLVLLTLEWVGRRLIRLP